MPSKFSWLTLCFALRYHCKPYWEGGKFKLCTKFAEDLWFKCRKAGTFTTGACATNEGAGLTRDTFIARVLGNSYSIVEPVDANKPADSCFNAGHVARGVSMGLVAVVVISLLSIAFY